MLTKSFKTLALQYHTKRLSSLARWGARAQDFRENLNLFLPENTEKQLEPLNMEIEDLPVKVCLLYRNGASLTDIKGDFRLSHPTQVRRKLVEGLDILLKSYDNVKKG